MLLRNFVGVFLWLYLQIVYISCEEGGSLAFAIDDTFSMDDDITAVKKGAEAIMKLVLSKKSDIKELVLVTFNDPDVQLRTKNSSQNTFLNDLSLIKPHDGGDCPEMALTGIEEALKASRPGSYIYVFTDANAKDHDKVLKIQSLCQEKQSQVVIVYSQDINCFEPRGVQFTVYYDVAKACSGQVFIMQKNEVDSVINTIETLLQGKNSIFKWITIPRTDSYVSVPFTLDEKAEYAIVSTSGTNVGLQVTSENNFNSPQVKYEKTMWNVNGKVVKLVDPSPGIYYAWVKGESSISVVVYGRTDFTFEHGFSTFEHKLLADTSKRPKAGLEQYLYINITDPDNSVNIQTVQILDINNNDTIVYELPLRSIGKNFYISEAFVSPNYTFRIAVKGEIKKTKKTITRISKNIVPEIVVDLIPESIPDVKIDEGMNKDVNYGSGVYLTCKVTAHPAPKIEWYTSSGLLLPSKSFVIDDPLFVSYLKLQNIKKSETFICKASNKNGPGRDSKIQVNVRPIFTKIGEVPINAKYGEDVKIPCNIKSDLPITIKWFRSGKQLSGGKYTISSDGSELTITSIDMALQGIYTCEATLKSDPTIKQTHDRDVKITGLDDFDGDENLYGSTRVVYAEQGKSKTIICNLKHLGEFQVRWYKDGMLLKQTGSTYTIERAYIADEGIYTCRAITNDGIKSVTYALFVGYLPIFKDNSPSLQNINWQEDIQMLDCSADSQPPPRYEWLYNGKVLEVGNYLPRIPITYWGEYTCRVSNVFGNISKTFKVITSGCYITKNIATQNQPLVSQIDTPTSPTFVGNSDLLLKENEEIKLSCPNTRKSTNTFKILPGKKEIIAKCNAQDNFFVEGKTYKYSDLQCITKVEPSVWLTESQCSGPNSRMIRVGFEVNGFMEAYTVCYDITLNVPLYASATTPIFKKGNGVDSIKFEWSSAPELDNRKIGNWKPEGSCKCCYTQGQLVNVKELAFGPAQAATFKDNLNSVAIWNPSCDGSKRTSWQTFENAIRDTAFKYVKPTFLTGAIEYAPKDGGLVPRYLWKVINYGESSTVMVYVNDKYPVDSDIRCSSPCQSMEQPDKFLYCCTLDEFRSAFGYNQTCLLRKHIPKHIRVSLVIFEWC